MATFEAQVEGLTTLALTSSSTPTQNQLSQFLKDGVLDVTNKWLSIRPEDAENFQRSTSTSDSQGVSVGGSKIISVIREANSDGSADGTTVWQNCTKVSSSMQSRVVDTSSLMFSSIYNPVYTMNSDKTINVYPVPSANNGFKVYYVNEEPRDITNNAALAYTHENIKYFPNDKVYLVVIYAAMKSLEAKLSDFSVNEEDVELVQSLTPMLQSLQNDYNSAFLPDRNVDAVRSRSQQQQQQASR